MFELDKVIDDLIKNTQKRIAQIERLLYTSVFEYLTDNIDISDNTIKYTNKNLITLNSLKKGVSEKLDKKVLKLYDMMIKGITSVLVLNAKDLKEFDVRAIEISKPVNKTILNHAKRNITQKVALDLIYEDVRKTAIELMSNYNGISLRDLRKQLEVKIVKKKLVNRYWSRWTHDIYSQYQRVGANEVRKKIGLKYAMYEGGLIETSRDFCESKNGTVVTEEEVESWINQDWEGKNEIGYDPFIDLGGYNCRHRLRWISDELAKKLRPELA